MIHIEEYIKLPKPNRQHHIDLTEKCSEIGGSGSVEFKGLLAYYVGSTIPSHGLGHKIMLCHACGNAKCSNVKHLYWGTGKENVADSKEHGTYKSRYQKSLDKYGIEGMKIIAAKAGKASGEAKRKPESHWESYRDSFDQVDRTKRGWVSILVEKENISHTQVRRIARHLCMI